jgi:hypothetical protein
MSDTLMGRLPRCLRPNSNGLPCGDFALTWVHTACARTYKDFCDTDICHPFVGDPPSIADSPAVASTAIPEPPASGSEPDGSAEEASHPISR